jgi:hypothetical protein
MVRGGVATNAQDSLQDAEAGVAAAWAAEIDRRAAEARENPSDDEDWRAVLDEIQREGLAP